MNPSTETKQPGLWQRSVSLVNSSITILKRDKKLMRIPLTATAICLAIFTIYGLAVFFTTSIDQTSGGISGPLVDHTPLTYLVLIGVSLLTAFIAQFFTAALVSGILMRLRGVEPSLADAYKNARDHLGSIVSFTALSLSIGMLLNILEDRLPIAGKIATWIAGAAWSVASMFAIPVIVTSKQKIGPLQATRESVNIIKKTWGENLVARLGVGIVGVMAIVSLLIISSGVWIAVGAFTSQGGSFAIPTGMFVSLLVINLLVFFGLVFILSMLDSIIKSAVFYYGTTGEAPAEFEERVLKSSFTAKQARGLFS